MKVIIIGDLHFGLIYKGISFNERIIECLRQIYVEIKEVRPDLVVLLGDLFHNSGYSIDAITYVIRLLKRYESLGCRIEVVQGNHDKKKFRNDECDLFDLLEEFKFKHIEFRRSSISFRADKDSKSAFLFIPYLDKTDLPEEYSNVQQYLNEESKEVLKKLKEKWPKFRVYVFSHLSVEGARTGSEIEFISTTDISVPKCLIESKRVKQIFNGHIHLRQEVGKVIMPGSIESFRFGEGREKFFLEVEL